MDNPQLGFDLPRPPAFAPYLLELLPPFHTQELLVWLNELLEGERAGARGLRELAKSNTSEVASLLEAVAHDEGRFCVMLRRHISRLGGQPSDKTGVFYEKLLAKDALASQLSLLVRGQAAVVRSLEKLLPRVTDKELANDLRDMLDVHAVNIHRCQDLGLRPDLL